MTTVANIKTLKAIPDNAVYIGRAVPGRELKLKQSCEGRC
jgi:hypothetical protein